MKVFYNKIRLEDQNYCEMKLFLFGTTTNNYIWLFMIIFSIPQSVIVKAVFHY
jgi:hypothetical protein